MRNKIVWLLAVLLGLPLAILPSKALASSVFDSTVRLTDDATIRCYNYMDGLLTGDRHNLSESWSALVNPTVSSFEGRTVNRSFGSIDPDDVYDAFQDRQSDGKGWGMSVVDDGPSYGNFVRVYVQKNTSSAYFTNPFGSDPDWYLLASDNTYTLNIHCRNNGFLIEAWEGQAIYARSGSTATSVYMTNTDISYPSGYEGVLVPHSPPAAKYVAMGDSFSSGEGNPAFEYGTDENGVNECHRSLDAYSRLLQNDSSLNHGPTAFVACSGATTSDVLYGGTGDGNWDEGAQVDVLSEETDLVTITIGGNDVGFSDYATACVVAPCGPNTPGSAQYNAIMTNINSSAFLDNLETTYETILDEGSSSQVHVLDYPYLVDPTGNDAPTCSAAGGADFSGVLQIQQALNGVISDAVENVQAISGDYLSRLHYVPTNYSGTPYADHHLCTDDPDGSSFNGLDLLNQEHSYHPNVDGQEDYADVVKDYLS